jgi:hypothetical protein
MKPVLYRYRDSESVIKAMEGYTPGEGWTPLYDQAEIDAAAAAERERCAKVCDAIAYEWRGANSQSVQCADAIRKGE